MVCLWRSEDSLRNQFSFRHMGSDEFSLPGLYSKHLYPLSLLSTPLPFCVHVTGSSCVA